MHPSNPNSSATNLAIFSVLFFIISTLLICICAYCLDFKKICRSIIYFFCFWKKSKTKKNKSKNKNKNNYEYHGINNGDDGHENIFTNEHFINASETSPIPSDEMPKTWRNAVITGTPPYRKFTTISTTDLPLSRNGSSKKEDCVISAV